jgi:MYXO-CTERM domain-containing protein
MLGGVDGASFVLTSPTLPLTLQPGASTEVAVTFRPDTERLFSAQLVVGSNDAEMPSVVVPMFGTGVRQQIQLSVTSLEFGQQLINHTSSPRKVRVINNSDASVTLSALKVEGVESSRFSLSSLALPLSIHAGQQQEVSVAFTPLSETEVNGVLKFSFNELPQPLEVALRGKGIPTVLSVKPSPLDFGGVRVGGGRREQPLTVSNLSSDPIVLAMPEVTYTTGEPFTYDAASLQGRVLEPGASVIVPVGYQPVVETLSETTLSFGTTTPSRPRSAEVQLKGRAMQRLLSVDTTRLEFGQVDAGTTVAPKTVTLTNNSSQQQRVVVMLKNLEGSPFTLETKALANPLPAGGTATFSVAFNPQTAGDFQNEVGVWLQGETEAEARISATGSRVEEAEQLPGGCSCGSTEAGSAGMLALLALVGLGSRRRRA